MIDPMPPARFGLTAALAMTVVAAAQQPQRPVIRSGVELVAVDVQVVDRDGRPIETLGPGDFEVLIDGRRREVVSAELVRHEVVDTREGEPARSAGSPTVAPGPPAAGRRFILAIDEHSFHPATARAAMHAARLFIERLQPTDLVGLYTYPTGSAHSDLTDDHAAVIRALDGVTGLLEIPMTRYRITTSEAIDIASGNTEVLRAVQKRECSPYDPTCLKAIWVEAMTMAQTFEMQVSQSLGGLRALFDGLKALEGRKTLVLVSAGLLSSDNAGGRVKMSGDIQAMGAEAARSNTNLYVLHIDWSFLQAYSASNRSGVSLTLFRDMSQTAAGLEQFADAGSGAYIRVQTGAGERGFERILRENAAYYLLGVAVEPGDRDGQPHRIQVRTRQRGATVRSRAFVIIPASQ
jgi:VWFA-related protein